MGCRKRRNKIMCRQRCTANLLVTVRCAVQALFHLLRMRQQCCKLTSCAARAAKGQQERERARKQRKQKHRKKQQIVAGCFR